MQQPRAPLFAPSADTVGMHVFGNTVGFGGDGVPEWEWQLEALPHALSAMCVRRKARDCLAAAREQAAEGVRCTNLVHF